MKRWLFNIATGASLVLCVATAVLFVHSGFGYAYLSVGTSASHAHWEFGSARGRLYCNRIVHAPGFPDQVGWRFGGGPGSGPASWSWQLGGFDAYYRPSPGEEFRQYVVPDYFALFVLVVLPAWWWMTRRRCEPGHCTHCGYDLRVQLALSEQRESNGRATPDRCPECGAVPNGIKLTISPRRH